MMTDDVMIFPKTWEEFEQHYGFYDIRHVYTYGNTKLIPSFRVQQWLNHIDDIKRKQQSQKNKMQQVAAMFGKKLDERFTVKYNNCLFDCAFKDCGFIVYGVCDDFDAFLLHYLLIGRAVIIDE